MNTEIETLKKLAAGTISKGKLPAITAALEETRDLAALLEAKSEADDDIVEFEELESQLENALSDVESGCEELEIAEEKEERDDAIDQIETALGEAITYLEAIMNVAVISEVDHQEIFKEAGAKFSEVVKTKGNPEVLLETWYNSSPSDAVKRSRKKAIKKIYQAIAEIISKQKN